MISSDRLDFLDSCFLIERERFSQSIQLSVNQLINSPGTSFNRKPIDNKSIGFRYLYSY